MSKLRSVNTHFWDDTYIIELDPIEKLLFLYLLTNVHTNMLGIYEISTRKIAFDTGIDRDMIVKICGRFERDDKVSLCDGYILMHKHLKHQNFNGNMGVSAINAFNNLPENIKIKARDCGILATLISICRPFTNKDKQPILKGMEPIGKGSEPITKGYPPETGENGHNRHLEQTGNTITKGFKPMAKGSENRIEIEYEIEGEGEAPPPPIFILDVEPSYRRDVVMQQLSTTSLTQPEKEMYMNRIESNSFTRKQGGEFISIRIDTIRADAELNKSKGWLKSAEPESNTKVIGGYI